jgi:hypothetical protein
MHREPQANHLTTTSALATNPARPNLFVGIGSNADDTASLKTPQPSTTRSEIAKREAAIVNNRSQTGPIGG